MGGIRQIEVKNKQTEASSELPAARLIRRRLNALSAVGGLQP